MEIDKISYKRVDIYDLEYLNQIPIVEYDGITYNEFFDKYLINNQACLIKNVANNWQSYKKWIRSTDDDCNDICFSYLKSKYGDYDVTVYNCSDKYYDSQRCETWKFKDYMDYWLNLKKLNNESDEIRENKAPLYYLKDWHLKNAIPKEADDHDFYDVPKYFLSDMLNEYLLDTNGDDYRFVYMGPKGTWTPFHADVFYSYSWSTNLCGKKKWFLFPPGVEDSMRDNLGNLPYDVANGHPSNRCYEIVQNERETIFVPSGWHHQVINLTDTVSINHNWINAANLLATYRRMSSIRDKIANETIADCRGCDDFRAKCQLILKSIYGMDHVDYYHFLHHIVRKRIHSLQAFESNDRNHAIYDLCSLSDTLTAFREDLERSNDDEEADKRMLVDLDDLRCRIDSVLQ